MPRRAAFLFMQKNDIITAVAGGYGSEGEAVFVHSGTPVFVPGAIEGEEAEIKILSVKGGVAYGKLLRVLSPSPVRVVPPCPVFGRCGGCQLQHMSYAAQRELKTGLVKNTLKKIAGIDCDVRPAVGSSLQYRYRNKLVLPIGAGEGGSAAIGFYAPRSHRIICVNDCPIQAPWCAAVISAVKEFMQNCGLSGYDETTRKGDLRRIAVREVGGRFIAALVAAKYVDCAPLARLLSGALGEVTLLLNVNSSTGNAVFGKEWHTVSGGGFFEAEDMGIKFRAGANTFLQVNDGVRSELYSAIVREAAGSGNVAIDLYSGGGMLTALLARACGAAYGIEVVQEASACADELMELNGLSGQMFNVCGTVEGELAGVFARTRGMNRVIVCDPPRKGMERSVTEAIKGCGADKVILVSCNPATLARDLGILLGSLKDEGGVLKKTPDYVSTSAYRISYIQPYDMFPQTKHVETLVLLCRV